MEGNRAWMSLILFLGLHQDRWGGLNSEFGSSPLLNVLKQTIGGTEKYLLYESSTHSIRAGFHILTSLYTMGTNGISLKLIYTSLLGKICLKTDLGKSLPPSVCLFLFFFSSQTTTVFFRERVSQAFFFKKKNPEEFPLGLVIKDPVLSLL